MKLTAQLTALREETRGLTRGERARRCCEVAKQLEKAGEYETACEALSEFWPERNGPPNIEDLDQATRAEVLLRVGALAGWFGSTDQIEGSQETAKNLISQSLDLFQRLGLSERVAEARGDLALCYWREGAYDEARIHLADALALLGDEDTRLKAVLLIRAGIVEVWAQKLNDALHFYKQAVPLVDRSKDHALKGSLHIEYGLVFKLLAAPENREDYLDRALMEYTAASFHFQLAGNTRYLARVENNLGSLLFTIGRFQDAHKHLDRARHFFLELRDTGAIAQVDDTRARTLLAEGHVVEAERLARYAVHILERGDEQAALAGALTTHAVALARLANYGKARNLLDRAISVAETTGDLEGAGRAKVSVIEELAGQTPAPQLVSIYRSAIELLRQSQDLSTIRRLIACSEKILEALGVAESEESRLKGQEGDLSWASFKREVREAEQNLIERALRQSEGSVTNAARLLGFKHHQSLISIIDIRHPDLKKSRSRIRKRRHHLISEPKKRRRKAAKPIASQRTSQIAILHVEDNAQVANLVAGMFAEKNWSIELCAESETALLKLTGDEHYDLLIIGNDLADLNGLELIQRVRKMSHRRRTPIIMLSGEEIEPQAWGAGADEFLRKPRDLHKVPATIARLLNIKLKGK